MAEKAVRLNAGRGLTLALTSPRPPQPLLGRAAAVYAAGAVAAPLSGAAPARGEDAFLERRSRAEDAHGGVVRGNAVAPGVLLDGGAIDLDGPECGGVLGLQSFSDGEDTLAGLWAALERRLDRLTDVCQQCF